MPLYGFEYGEPYGYPLLNLYAQDDAATIDDGAFDITTEDYAFSIEQLLPHGLAWNFKPGGVAKKLFRGLSLEFSRVERRVRELMEEFDPRTAQELLEDWERVAGLPEECVGANAPTTLDGRQDALHTKLTNRPVGNAPLFLALAESLGYPDAEIRYEGDPFLCTDPCTDGLYGHEGGWLYFFTLVANASGENDVTLECRIREYAQAHEIVEVEFP